MIKLVKRGSKTEVQMVEGLDKVGDFLELRENAETKKPSKHFVSGVSSGPGRT